MEMPAFDLDSVLHANVLENDEMRTSFQFAHKFYTHIEKGKQGTLDILPDGTKVWRVGIRSQGAYSINLLFTKYHVPEGAKLFVYNTDYNYIAGSFDHRNNSDKQILPIRPVAGEAIIVEYSEPANAPFEGELIIGEVNHDYWNILAFGELRSGPRIPDVIDYPDSPDLPDHPEYYLCMPDVLCEDADTSIIRSTVLLLINGTGYCTGSLLNNTSNDEKPYLLTAVHCFNTAFPATSDFYTERAGTVIAFFNYQRPICGSDIKPAVEMSIAGAIPRAIVEKKDIALLELTEKPPVYYNAYYAGWNVATTADNPPYTNVHHPFGAPKRYGLYDQNLSLVSFATTYFDQNIHWKIASWNIGSTHPGSSGSPLFDKNKLIVGTLTGGNSTCDGNTPGGESDYFAAFYKGWTATNSELKTCLDPGNTGNQQQAGYDPHTDRPLYRIGNADYNNGDQLVNDQFTEPNSGFVFGNNNLNTVEFAEEFNLEQASEVFGVYLFIPSMPFAYTSGIEIEIYQGTNAPETLLATRSFVPQYVEYSRSNQSFGVANNQTDLSPTESFVAFDHPVNVNKKFFIAYKINSSSENQFAVYNTLFSSPEKANTAWLNNGSQWVKATEYTPHPCTTSLALQPLLRYRDDSFVPTINTSKKEEKLYYDPVSHQLSFTFELGSAGEIWVYSISGQIIEHLSFAKGDKAVRLASKPHGTVGIVKVTHREGILSGKIIY
jgi:hypothetical protein